MHLLETFDTLHQIKTLHSTACCHTLSPLETGDMGVSHDPLKVAMPWENKQTNKQTKKC